MAMKHVIPALAAVMCAAARTAGAGTALPDLLKTADGRTVDGVALWEKVRRAEVAQAILPVEYGTMPKEPVEVRVAAIGSSLKGTTALPDVATRKLKVWCDMDGREVSFVIQLWYGKDVPKSRKLPVLIDGDRCWEVLTDREIAAAVARGWMVVHFNRCEVALDDLSSKESTLFKWAWTYHRAIDALLKAEPRVDPRRIAITGHSRGGKTVQLAAATDTRIFAVGDNCSGCGGSAPYRNAPRRAETLKAITRSFPYWFAPTWGTWAGRENALPFDQHFLSALIAPRKLFIRHGTDDLWANPPGSRRIYDAARPVWALYGKEENLCYSIRTGGHGHKFVDYMAFLDFIEGRPAGRKYLLTAHAGAMDTKPNTVESLQRLVKTDVDFIEIDVSFRPSGLPVVIHDAAPRENEGTPLEDALAVLGPSEKHVQFDIKAFNPRHLAQLPKMIVDAGLEKRTFFAGAQNTNDYAVLRKACPGLCNTLNCKPPKVPGPEMDALVATCVKIGAEWANVNYKNASRAFADALHARGIRLSVWTADSAETIEACAALDPDNITTLWIPPELAGGED